MLKDALSLVDVAFSRSSKPLPDLELGIETLGSLKRKLDEGNATEVAQRSSSLSERNENIPLFLCLEHICQQIYADSIEK
jgi:hypothetical protein